MKNKATLWWEAYLAVLPVVVQLQLTNKIPAGVSVTAFCEDAATASVDAAMARCQETGESIQL